MGEPLSCFQSELVDRVRAAGGVWNVPGGQILLPRAFGFCRGVERALDRLDRAVAEHARDGKRLFLLGEVIHNPWVNDSFRRRGVTILSPEHRDDLPAHIGPDDVAVIPAFGVPLGVIRQLEHIGCDVVDCTCGDVRALWAWAERAAHDGFGVVIFGRSRHDETVVTKSRLAEAGGRYLVCEGLADVDAFCHALAAGSSALPPRFRHPATNAAGMDDFSRLCQVSQTTMLFDDTMAVQEKLRAAFEQRFGPDAASKRLRLQPTVCRATQQRQNAAVELCDSRPEVTIVVGGTGSSNTRHLFELARRAGDAYFVEGPADLLGPDELRGFDFDADQARVVRNWLPPGRPVRVGVLAGASTPEIVVGDVLERLATILAENTELA